MVLDAGRNPDPSRSREADAARRLDELEAVIDSALGQLSVPDLLVELLQRVRGILDADTAAVLLLDESTQQLVATAACGLEEEVREGVHVPVGTGFAGRVANLRRPVSLNRIDETTVADPILWEKGIKVMLGVPLMAGGQVLGVLHVGRLRNAPFDKHDEDLLQVAAQRIAGATQSRRLAVEQAAASLLERSLLPEGLPRHEGLELAARYVTPENRAVGGDWYDVFSGEDGRLWAVTGDVAGHGLGAAVVMGRVRSALRAYTLVDDAPERVLELTDRKVQHFEMGTMVTVVCATSAPPYDTWSIATAGHPPPVIALPDGQAHHPKLPVGPPLGGTPGITRSAAQVTLAAGRADAALHRRPDRAPRRVPGRRARAPAHGHPHGHSGLRLLPRDAPDDRPGGRQRRRRAASGAPDAVAAAARVRRTAGSEDARSGWWSAAHGSADDLRLSRAQRDPNATRSRQAGVRRDSAAGGGTGGPVACRPWPATTSSCTSTWPRRTRTWRSRGPRTCSAAGPCCGPCWSGRSSACAAGARGR
jgi:hypothetical protein